MPVPSRIDSSMVMISARNRLLAPSPMIQLPKMVPTPVCVIMPMMVPTMAQAMPTASAALALSAGERVTAGGERGAAAARDEGDQDQQADDAGNRHDLEPVARDGRDDQRKSDPEDGAQRRVGDAERDAG